jgi:hypothetical protein
MTLQLANTFYDILAAALLMTRNNPVWKMSSTGMCLIFIDNQFSITTDSRVINIYQ